MPLSAWSVVRPIMCWSPGSRTMSSARVLRLVTWAMRSQAPDLDGGRYRWFGVMDAVRGSVRARRGVRPPSVEFESLPCSLPVSVGEQGCVLAAQDVGPQR
jgi:hypothetical protein